MFKRKRSRLVNILLQRYGNILAHPYYVIGTNSYQMICHFSAVHQSVAAIKILRVIRDTVSGVELSVPFLTAS